MTYPFHSFPRPGPAPFSFGVLVFKVSLHDTFIILPEIFCLLFYSSKNQETVMKLSEFPYQSMLLALPIPYPLDNPCLRHQGSYAKSF